MPENPIATSNISIYYNTGLSPEKNYIIDKLADWLDANADAVDVIEDFQMLDLKKELTIKLNLNQYNLSFDERYNADYCYIFRENGSFDEEYMGAYYFITNKRWLGRETIEFTLEMDTLNTFTWNSDYTVSDKTFVKREHKNRYVKPTSLHDTVTFHVTPSSTAYTYKNVILSNAQIKSATVTLDESIGSTTIGWSVSNTYHWIMIIVTTDTEQDVTVTINYATYAYIADVDLKSEGINPPLYKQDELEFADNSGTTWSLLYKNENNPDPSDLENPVNCFLYPGEDLNVYAPGSANEITSSNAPTDWGIILPKYNTPVPSFSFNGETFTPSYERVSGYGHTRETLKGIALKASGGQVAVQTCNFTLLDGTYYGSWADEGTVATVTVNTNLSEIKYHEEVTLPTAAATFGLQPLVYATDDISMEAVVTASIDSKDHIDKTDAKNIKLINLPYCPTPCSITNNYLTIGNEWWVTGNTLQLQDLNIKFKNSISTKYKHLLTNLILNSYPLTLDGTANRSILDPKCYHSDYYYPKFVYDSFSKIFRMECLDWQKSVTANNKTYFAFDFITSRNIVSKFMFMFPEYQCGSKGVEDYDNILPVARNNEEVLFNSQYLNYLRTGYNYDLKTKERNEATGALGIGLSIASLIGSVALTASGYGSGIGVAGIVGSVAGLAGSAINYAKTTAQSEENIQRKIQETQNQGVSVLNADDYDLLEAYSNNRAKMCTYQTSTAMTNALDDMFFYSGYTVNEQYIPSVNSRFWFNFVQADLVVDKWKANIPQNIRDDIYEKFNQGVTFFHCRKIGGTDTWNLAQTKENWEKWIIDEHYIPYYANAVISDLWIDDDGAIGCTLDTTTGIRTGDYLQFEYYRSGIGPIPDVTAVENGPISSGTVSISVAIDPDQYMYAGSVIRCRIVSTVDPRDTTDWTVDIS